MFAKFAKSATISFECLSFCPQARTRIPLHMVMKFFIWEHFENLPRKVKFHWNFTRIKGASHEGQYTFLSHLPQLLLEWEMFQMLYRKSKHTFNIQKVIPRKSCVYETMLKTIVQPGRPQTTTWRMRIACYENTLIIRNTYSFSTATLVVRTVWFCSSSCTL